MKTRDRLKEEIGLYKLLMTILSAMLSSAVSWLLSNLDNIELKGRIILLFGIFIFFISTIFFLIEIVNKIQELDHE
jgi:hypothetical protein